MVILVEHLAVSFAAQAVLRDVSFEAAAGELVLLLGANGSGKSTLLRCLLGLISYEGRVEIAGCDPLLQGRQARARIGYMPQEPGLHGDLEVRETLRFYADLRRASRSRGRELAEELELGPFLRTRVRALSGGLRQRLQFALALLHDPPVLLLDEPTASLDEWSRDLLARTSRRLADAGKTILLSTHARRDLLEVADRSLVLTEGRAVVGLPREAPELYGAPPPEPPTDGPPPRDQTP